MCPKFVKCGSKWTVLYLVFLLCHEIGAKQADEEEITVGNVEHKIPNKMSGAGMTLLFVEEMKLMMERHVLGICPQNYRLQPGNKPKNATATTCDAEMDPNDLAGRLASLALRAHSVARTNDCSRLGATLASAFTDLARHAAQKQTLASNAAADANKKRKLSKSQKAKIQAKQRTALAVKKKAAAVAAAAAARVAS